MDGLRSVLDIGCGNGALLEALEDRVERGIGVDVSLRMIELARSRFKGEERVSFVKVDGPALPFPDSSFDLVISFLSYRYLDWEGIGKEILRVLKNGGRFLCIDMAGAKIALKDLPRLALSTGSSALIRIFTPGFAKALRALVRHPSWRLMLERHPLRPIEAYREHAERVFGSRIERLSVGRRAKVIAFEAVKPA
jgi:ubiquinone/menaquinone biosynthesis C-methylase UbiE